MTTDVVDPSDAAHGEAILEYDGTGNIISVKFMGLVSSS